MNINNPNLDERTTTEDEKDKSQENPIRNKETSEKEPALKSEIKYNLRKNPQKTKPLFSSTSKKEKNNKSNISNEDYKILESIINKIKKHECAIYFQRPAVKDIKEKKYKKMYLRSIKHPMDLSIIRRRFNKKKYLNIQQIYDDISLIWDNAQYFNCNSSDVYKDAEFMRDFTNDLFKKKKIEVNFIEKPKKNIMPLEEKEEIKKNTKIKKHKKKTNLDTEEIIESDYDTVEVLPNAEKDNKDNKKNLKLTGKKTILEHSSENESKSEIKEDNKKEENNKISEPNEKNGYDLTEYPIIMNKKSSSIKKNIEKNNSLNRNKVMYITSDYFSKNRNNNNDYIKDDYEKKIMIDLDKNLEKSSEKISENISVNEVNNSNNEKEKINYINEKNEKTKFQKLKEELGKQLDKLTDNNMFDLIEFIYGINEPAITEDRYSNDIDIELDMFNEESLKKVIDYTYVLQFKNDEMIF